MRKFLTAAILIGFTLSLGACGCTPGRVGPYGGVHPGRCWVG